MGLGFDLSVFEWNHAAGSKPNLVSSPYRGRSQSTDRDLMALRKLRGLARLQSWRLLLCPCVRPTAPMARKKSYSKSYLRCSGKTASNAACHVVVPPGLGSTPARSQVCLAGFLAGSIRLTFTVSVTLNPMDRFISSRHICSSFADVTLCFSKFIGAPSLICPLTSHRRFAIIWAEGTVEIAADSI